MFWTQREDAPDANAARENLGTPDRCLIEEGLSALAASGASRTRAITR